MKWRRRSVVFGFVSDLTLALYCLYLTYLFPAYNDIPPLLGILDERR